ncbi:hypothetical protein LSAT2_029069 [Lamellibrachia satsuma]|nr:hypothetical protein LSAT2_029069 [Lamellibrachia satsuma]
MHALPPIRVAGQIIPYVETLEVSREWMPPRRHMLISFSQNIVNEVHHVASGHNHAVAHEFDSIVPFRFGFGFKYFHRSLGFLTQGFLSAISASTRSTAADPATPAASFFLRRPVVHNGHSCRLLRAYILMW